VVLQRKKEMNGKPDQANQRFFLCAAAKKEEINKETTEELPQKKPGE